jgi:hypothetical protein
MEKGKKENNVKDGGTRLKRNKKGQEMVRDFRKWKNIALEAKVQN